MRIEWNETLETMMKLTRQITIALLALLATTQALAHRFVIAPPETIQARQHFFGFENVNPRTGKVREDRVIFSWFSNTSFAVALRGRILLLDAFIVGREDRPERVSL